MKMIRDKTERGFKKITFRDRYDEKCSLQKSSLASENCIWLGIDETKAIIMASDAKQAGIITNERNGYIDYPIPETVSISTRMHLTQDMAKTLIKELKYFVKKGELR